jgi:phytoene synthase
MSGSRQGRTTRWDRAVASVTAGGPPVSAADWARCRAVAHAHGRTFAFASRFLPPARRRAIHAVYAYCRVADDVVDRAGEAGRVAAERALTAWEAELDTPRDPIAVAFAAARARYAIPAGPARELLVGLRMDLAPARFAAWDDLRVYCYRVAGTVGLMVAPILGCRDPAALPWAVELGIAMQLTNILRDVAEDAAVGRLYLPLTDLAAFGVAPDSVLAGRPNGRFGDLIAFEIARARGLYASAARGIPALDPAGRFTVLASARLYSAILDRLEAQGGDPFRGRARLSTRRKLQHLPAVVAVFARQSVRIGGARG